MQCLSRGAAPRGGSPATDARPGGCDAKAQPSPVTHASLLHALDSASISWFHIKVSRLAAGALSEQRRRLPQCCTAPRVSDAAAAQAVVIAGMGFFADAYDLFSISLLTRLLGRIYYQDYVPGAKPGKLPIDANAAVTALALVGTLLGQLVFGWLGDRIGRKRIYGVSLLFMIVSSLCSAMSFGTEPRAVIGTLCFFRFWLGFGVGGDYPLSATIMSEYANKNNRGGFVAAVFAMQGIGILTAAAVALIVTAIFNNAFPGTPYGKSVDLIRGSCPKQADYVWRIVLAFGAFPALLTMYARMMMPETPRYTLHVKGNIDKATNDVARVMNNGEAIGQLAKPPPPPVAPRAFWRKWWKPLLGCSMSWFLLDIAFYSQNLFQKDVFDAVGWIPKADHMNALDETYRIARAQALIALGSTVPGYWFTVFTIDRLGRKPIQFGGFLLMTIFMASLSGWYIPLRDSHQAGFVTMYALTFFFSNFGPNATTFVIPAELFPTSWKTTAHGIAAASGKAGAIVGAFGFLYASQPRDAKAAAPYPTGIGLRQALGVLAAINFAGMLFTTLIPETKGKTLEEINGEDVLPLTHAAEMAQMDTDVPAPAPATQHLPAP